MRLSGWIAAVLVAGCAYEHRIEITGADAEADFHVDEGDPHGDDTWPGDPWTDGWEDPVDPDITGDVPWPCESDPDVWTYFTVDGTDWPREERLDYTIRCTVPSTEAWAERLYYHMDCRSDSGETGYHRIEISSQPWVEETGLPGVPEGRDLLFRYIVEAGHPPARWFTISTLAGEMLLAGIDAPTIVPPGRAEILSPVEIEVASGLCPVEVEECYDPERAALEVLWDGFETRIFHGQAGTVGWSTLYYHVLVENATLHHDPGECGVARESWFTALIYRRPTS